jgi:CRISPR system Cascade subunit CasE
MYFSVITPEQRLLRQAAHEMTKTSYAEHQWIWKFFPSTEEQPRDFIFRRHDADQRPRFYVVSKRPPLKFSDAWQIQSKDYDPQLSEGQRLSFQLRVNPVITKKNDKGEQKRHDVVMQAKKQLLAEHKIGKWSDWKDDDNKPQLYELVQDSCVVWLEGLAKGNGFEIAWTNEEKSQRKLQVDAYQQNRAGKRDIRFSTVDLSGELLVVDPESFQHALFNGLGHAKAFGCGLLLVKRADS